MLPQQRPVLVTFFFFRPTPDGSRQVVYQACETLFATEPLQTHVRQPFNKAAQRLCAN